MRILSWFIGLPLAVLVMLFALSNREAVSVGLWPFALSISLPLALALLTALLIGLILGLLIAGFGTMRARFAARAEARKSAALERELASMRPPASAPTSPPPPASLPPP